MAGIGSRSIFWIGDDQIQLVPINQKQTQHMVYVVHDAGAEYIGNVIVRWTEDARTWNGHPSRIAAIRALLKERHESLI